MTRQELFKKKDRHIGFDIDGVVANINSQAVNSLNAAFDPRAAGRPLYQHDSVSSWDWVYEEALRLGLARGHVDSEAREIAKRLRATYYNPEALRNCAPYPGAILILRWLEQLGVPYDFITTRRPETTAATVDWFNRYVPWVERARVHIRGDKNVDEDEFKLLEAQKIPVRLFFEDKPETARHLLGGHIAIGLVDRSWNRGQVDLDRYRIRHGSLGIFTRALIFAAAGH